MFKAAPSIHACYAWALRLVRIYKYTHVICTIYVYIYIDINLHMYAGCYGVAFIFVVEIQPWCPSSVNVTEKSLRCSQDLGNTSPLWTSVSRGATVKDLELTWFSAMYSLTTHIYEVLPKAIIKGPDVEILGAAHLGTLDP